MSRLHEEVKDRKAEIENLPDFICGKSIGGTIIESTLEAQWAKARLYKINKEGNAKL